MTRGPVHFVSLALGLAILAPLAAAGAATNAPASSGHALATPGLATQAEYRRYTLEQCLAIGLERAVPLANARRDEAIARAKTTQAGAQAWPQINLNGTYTRLDKLDTVTFGDQTMELGKLNTYTAGAQANQLLYSGGVVAAAIRAARQYQAYARRNTDAVRAELVRDITQGFYEVLFAGEAVRVRQESVNHLKTFLAQTELKFTNGSVSEFELLSAQVRLANETPLLILATNQLEVAKEAYRNLLNLDEGPFDLVGTLETPVVELELEALFRLAATNRPELRRMEAQLGMLREDVAAARGAYLPTLRAFGRYMASNTSGMGGSSSDGEWDPDWRWSAGITAQWDILDGGLRRGRIAEKRLALEKAKADQTDLEQAVRLQVKQAYLDLVRSGEAVASTQGSVDLARKALKLADVRFQQGLSTYLEFTETNLALSRAQLTHLEALKDYAQALAAVRFACGPDAPPPTGETP
jgi:outer membrane protein TolC